MLKCSLRLLRIIFLIPIWIILFMLWIIVKLMVASFTYVKGLLTMILIFLLIGTLVWYRGEIWRYVMLGVTNSASMLILIAGITIELLLEEARKTVGGWMFC